MLHGIEYLPPHPLWGSGFDYGLYPEPANPDVYVPQGPLPMTSIITGAGPTQPVTPEMVSGGMATKRLPSISHAVLVSAVLPALSYYQPRGVAERSIEALPGLSNFQPEGEEAGVLSGTEVTKEYCDRIVCGVVTQQEAGWDSLLACSQAGYQGVKPYCHPDCAPYYAEIARRYGYLCGSSGGEQQAATRELIQPPPVYLKSLTPALPSMTALARVNGTGEEATVAERAGSALCAFQDWVSQNPYWAAAVVIGAALLAKRGEKK